MSVSRFMKRAQEEFRAHFRKHDVWLKSVDNENDDADRQLKEKDRQ